MRRYHVFPKLTHVPGHVNTIADSLSRFKQPLPEPLTVSNHCLVRWQELLASSPVCIAQTGRKWPSKFGIDVKKRCGSPLTGGSLNRFLFGGVCDSGWSIFDPHLFNQVATPGFWVCTSGLSFCVGDYKLILWSVRVSTRWYLISVQPPSRSFCTTPKNREPLQLLLCVMHFHAVNICKLKQRKLNCERGLYLYIVVHR